MQQSAKDPTSPKISIDKSFVKIGFFRTKITGSTTAAVAFVGSEPKEGAKVKSKRLGEEEGLKLGPVGADVGCLSELMGADVGCSPLGAVGADVVCPPLGPVGADVVCPSFGPVGADVVCSPLGIVGTGVS